ncbi:uncharacterized protein LOC110031201 [Phalaenopsis equestris]|uniref:uncharacterized protein LOC110031201 n=1 Tax=Phalaenopsis equestris TaxID=78828 RepID=UPI0009E4B66F|nr:uncharacterized protein LOC110031201 [Phalaenopsis equestris]XP_020589958.1 uncharacterized protein LOC110031201 [Phalaenopsis equestris]
MPPLALSLRRSFYCCKVTSFASAAPSKKKNLVFLGSPRVSLPVLDALLDASSLSTSIFRLAAIVTQPPSRRDRGRKMMQSPVAESALERGFPQDLIFTPERAGEESFLSDLKALNPELCITAAYGNILPSKFLDIPPYGTVNVHPSLLPLYRGAAPVQRALQDGVKETGVSLAYTVRALDAGPVISQEKVEVDGNIKAPELLLELFGKGAKLLIRELPSILDGSAKYKAHAQDDSKASLAPKLKADESWISFEQVATQIHNKVRAFAGWPGTRARLQVIDGKCNANVLEIKIITTRVYRTSETNGGEDEILFGGSSLLIPCAGSTLLEVLELQLPGKRVTSAVDFWNGLRGRKLKKFDISIRPVSQERYC